MNIKTKYFENGGKTNGGPTKAELKERLKRLEIEKRKATVSRDLSGGLMFTKEEEFKDMAGLVNISDKVAAQADKYYSDKINEVKSMLESPEFMGGGKMYVKYAEGGKIKDDGDGPKFVVEGGSLKMVLGSGKTTDSWTADQLRRYLQDSGFLLQGGTEDKGTMAGQTSAGKYNLGEAIGKYRETGDLSSIALLIDTNRPGFEDLIPGMDYSSVSKEAREEKGISETGFTGKRFLVRRREERERAEAGMSGMSQE